MSLAGQPSEISFAHPFGLRSGLVDSNKVVFVHCVLQQDMLRRTEGRRRLLRVNRMNHRAGFRSSSAGAVGGPAILRPSRTDSIGHFGSARPDRLRRSFCRVASRLMLHLRVQLTADQDDRH